MLYCTRKCCFLRALSVMMLHLCVRTWFRSNKLHSPVRDQGFVSWLIAEVVDSRKTITTLVPSTQVRPSCLRSSTRMAWCTIHPSLTWVLHNNSAIIRKNWLTEIPRILWIIVLPNWTVPWPNPRLPILPWTSMPLILSKPVSSVVYLFQRFPSSQSHVRPLSPIPPI